MSTNITSISPQRLYTLRSQGSDVDLIDVRTPVEYRTGHVSGDKLLPLDDLRPETLATHVQHSGAGRSNPCTSSVKAVHAHGRPPSA